MFNEYYYVYVSIMILLINIVVAIFVVRKHRLKKPENVVGTRPMRCMSFEVLKIRMQSV